MATPLSSRTKNRILGAIFIPASRDSANPSYQRLKLIKQEEIYRHMVGAYVFKKVNSDRPCVFEFRDQTNYVTRASVLYLLKVPRVTSVKCSH